MRTIALFLVAAALAGIAAGQQVVVNSAEWTDVYSGMIFARLQGLEGSYLVDEGHGLLLQGQLDRSRPQVILIESAGSPYIRNYRANLNARGFQAELIIADERLNLELAARAGAAGYIVVDSRYSYNAVSVAPYAVARNRYVLFASEDNIAEVVQLVGQSTERPVLYGYLDRAVTGALAESAPVIINEGDKFSNNLEMLKLYGSELGYSQLLLTNGAFLEPQFFLGSSPVLFIGQSNIPEQTMEHLKESEVKHAMLIGYDIFNNAVALKDQAGMKIIVKFAKGIDSRQYALDIFSLPQPVFSVGISSAAYNKFSKMLEVSYFNPEDYPAFMKASHTVLFSQEAVATAGDDEAIFIGDAETYTATYAMELLEYEGESLVLRSSILYGEDERALEFLDTRLTEIEFISYEDSSGIEITKLVYDRAARRFSMQVRNTGQAAVYVKPFIRDIMMNDRRATLTGPVQLIDPGKSHTFRIKARLTAEDIEDNQRLTAAARYGRRESALVHHAERVFEMRLAQSWMLWAGIAAGMAVAVAWLIVRRRRRDDT